MNSEAIQIIKAIGDQWKFLLVLFLIIVVIIKWKAIGKLASNFTQIKVKRGENEIEIHRTIKQEETAVELHSQVAISETTIEVSDDTKLEVSTENTDFDKYFSALISKNFTDIDKLFERVLESKTGDTTIAWIKHYYRRYHYGDTQAFEKLEKFSLQLSTDEYLSNGLYYLSFCYQDSNDFPKALTSLTKALSLTKDDELKRQIISRLSELYQEKGEDSRAIGVILENINSIDNKASKSELFKSLGERYNKIGDKFLETMAYQKALETLPNNTSLMFDTAYRYSEINSKFTDLTTFLYKEVLNINSTHASALNNLGVSYSNLGLSCKSVKSYQQSFKNGNSLAGANLAYLLINNGFVDEANEYLDEAQKNEDVHNNVYEAVARLKSTIESEGKKEKEIVASAKQRYLFFSEFGNALFNLSLKVHDVFNLNLDGVTVKMDVKDDIINLNWIGNNEEEKHRITGKILNGAIIAEYSKPEKGLYSFQPKYTYKTQEAYGYITSNSGFTFLLLTDTEMQKMEFLNSHA